MGALQVLIVLACPQTHTVFVVFVSMSKHMGRFNEALQGMDLTYRQGLPLSMDTVCCLVRSCSKTKDLTAGRLIHSLIVSTGLISMPVLGALLIRLFTSHKSLLEANLVFCVIAKPSLDTWHAIISAHFILGKGKTSLELYHSMKEEGIKPWKCTFLCILKACGNIGAIGQGKVIHEQIIASGYESNAAIGSALVDMYAKCGSLWEARQVFDKVQNRDLVSWSTMMAGYTYHGYGLPALELFEEMQQEGLKPDRVMFLCILKACGNSGALEQGKAMHGHIIMDGLELDSAIGSALVDMYGKCGRVEEARRVFDFLSNRDVVSWNAMIAAYTQHGYCPAALELFGKMEREGVRPDKVLFTSILKACGETRAIRLGKLIHQDMIRIGLESQEHVQESLIVMYAKCGSLEDACKVSDNLPDRKLMSWNAVLAGYLHHGNASSVLELFDKMLLEGLQPDKVTFSYILKACGSVGATGQGMLIHHHIVLHGLQSDVVLGSILIEMYMKCGSPEDGHIVFDKLPDRNAVSWNSIIAGYVEYGSGLLALQLFREMQQQGIPPDKATLSCIMKACGSIGAIGQGRLIHNQIIKDGLELDVVSGSALVDMYVKCSTLEDADKVFDGLPARNVVCWNAMIAGYAQLGHGFSALCLLEEMQLDRVASDKVTFLCILKACSITGVISLGRLIHDHIIREGLDSDASIGSSLIDMYIKCGNLDEAQRVFDKLSHQNVVSWGSMIAGYVQHGQSVCALDLFKKMQVDGIKSDFITFLSTLKACGTVGAIEQGQMIHDQIIRNGLDMDVVIGSTILDMYAKCGRLQEAHLVYDRLPNQDIVSRNALIAGYAQHGNCKLARLSVEKMQMQGLEPADTTYTSILTTCSHAGQVEEGHQYFKVMRERYRIEPSILHFTCMIDLLGRAGCLNDAVELLQSMPIMPDITVWLALLTACRKYGNVDLGSRCFAQLVHLDPNIAAGYMLMSNIYADSHMWEDVHKIRELKAHVGARKKPGMAWIEVHDSVHEFIVGSKTHSQYKSTCKMLERLRRPMKVEGYVPLFDFMLESILDENMEEDISYA